MTPEVRPADLKQDLAAIVKIHQKCFPNFFMTQMGSSFLKEYYLTVLTFPHTLALVATDQHHILGFIVGFGQPDQFYHYYYQRRFRLLPIILQSVLRNPLLIRRILYNRQRITKIPPNPFAFELSSLGVSPELTRKGIGSLLIQSLLKCLKNQAYQTIYLTTDANNNEAVNQFYQKHHFHLQKTFLSDKRPMNYYQLTLPQPPKKSP